MYTAMLILPLIWLAASLSTPDLPPGDGKAIVQRACVGCHTLKVVTSKRATPQQWSTLVDQMISRGAEVEDDEIEALVAYLSKNFPANAKAEEAPADHDPPPADDAAKEINVNHATAVELAAGLGLSAKDADAIVAFREQNGDFKTMADLAKVPGIDTKKITSSKIKIRF
jgi:competence protein ComEA